MCIRHVTLTSSGCCVGRNENAQLGQGDAVRRDVPTLIDSLTGLNIVRVACGKAHTLFLTGTLSILCIHESTLHCYCHPFHGCPA